MEIEQDVDSNSSHQKAVLSSTVVIAGPSSLDLAINISKFISLILELLDGVWRVKGV